MIYFAEEGQSKRPVVWFDDLVIDIPFGEETETPPAEAPDDALRESLSAVPQRPFDYTQIMTDDTHHLADTEDRPDDHQHALEACQHAADAPSNGGLSRAVIAR